MSDQIEDVGATRRYIFACEDCGRKTQALEAAPTSWRCEELPDGSTRWRCDACWRRYTLDIKQQRRRDHHVATRCEACGASKFDTVCPECGIEQGSDQRPAVELSGAVAELSDDARWERSKARALLLTRRAVSDALAAGLTREELAKMIDEECVARAKQRATVKKREKPCVNK